MNIELKIKGVVEVPSTDKKDNPKRNRAVALVLSAWLGVLGIDRFYMKKPGTALLKLFLGPFTFFIWQIVDFFCIATRRVSKVEWTDEKYDSDTHTILAACSFGLDKIYLGQIFLGILKLLTFGGLGVWYLIDVYLIFQDENKTKYKEIYEAAQNEE